jgi:hypothetical protein
MTAQLVNVRSYLALSVVILSRDCLALLRLKGIAVIPLKGKENGSVDPEI